MTFAANKTLILKIIFSHHFDIEIFAVVGFHFSIELAINASLITHSIHYCNDFYCLLNVYNCKFADGSSNLDRHDFYDLINSVKINRIKFLSPGAIFMS